MNEELYQKIKKIDEEAAEHYRAICLFDLGSPSSIVRYPDYRTSPTLFESFCWDETAQGYEYWKDIAWRIGEEIT